MDVRADLLRAIERAQLELRARMGRKAQKKKKLKKIGRPAKTGPSAGCGTGAGGFKAGNNCATEDGIPQLPKSFAQGKKSAKAASLPATKEALAAKAEALKGMAKSAKISSARKKAAIRKKAKEEKQAAADKAAAEAKAAKKKAFVQAVRIKKANEQVKIAGTPKSVKEQLDEAKASMKAKTAEASKQLKVAGTPKSIKQEIEELKASKASAALKVVGTPKSVKQELDELKARQAAKKEAAPKKPPQEQAAGAHLGQQHLVKQNKSDQGKLNEERDAVFGKDLRAGWENYYGGGGEVAKQAKINLSIDKAKRLDKIGIKEEDIDDEMLLIMDPYKRYHGSQSADDRLSSSGVPSEYRRRYALSAGMTDSWASTSGDSNPTAVGIQYAIKDEFGVAKAYTRHLSSKDKSKNGKKAWDERISKVRKNKAVRAVLRAQYESTQDWFRAQGVAKVTLVRGYSSSAKINPTSEQNVSMQPASSFSMSKGIAQKFAEEGGPSKARHLTATVDVSRILSTARTGFGCLNEQELTILGGVIQGRVVNKPFDW